MKSENVTSIIIDPRFDIRYMGYYIKGLKDVCHNARMKWEIIPEISIQGEHQEDYRYLVCKLVYSDKQESKIVIATKDSCKIVKQYYDWCDVYGAINIRKEDLALEKCFAIGPGFGIRIYNPISTLLLCLSNYIKSRSYMKKSFKRFLLDYVYTFVRRLPLGRYISEGEEDVDYVYTFNTLWQGDFAKNVTNKLRGVFVRTCFQMFPKFEGGWYYINDYNSAICRGGGYADYLDEWKGMVVHKRVSLKEYLAKTKRSLVVFNCPAVDGCLGWKLGEYLAMGKAIISTPLNNVMPDGFVNGEQYIEVDDEQDIRDVISRLRENVDLRMNLKASARKYYVEVCSPQASAKRLLNNLPS